MSTIAYDPVKDRFAKFIRQSTVLRRIFYFLLDLFFLRSWHLRRIIRKTGDRFEEKGEWKLLDAGCGFGQYDRFILNRFKKVFISSVDVKKDYLADCRHYFFNERDAGRIHFYRQDLLRLDEKESYDMIICIDVMEHIEEDTLVLRNCAHALKSGGYFIMHSPSHYSADDAGEEDSFVGEHARTGYSKQDITQKLEAAGLRPESIFYTYGKFGHRAWVLSIKYPMILLNSTGMIGLLPLLFYYPVVLPVCLLLNMLDLYADNRKGNGICVVGRKL